MLLFSASALLPPMMQNLFGYPVIMSGLTSMPRGIGAVVGMFVVGQLIGRVDIRIVLLTGLTLNCIGLWQMMQFDLSMTVMPLLISGFIQSLGVGMIFVPLTTLAFADHAGGASARGLVDLQPGAQHGLRASASRS